MRESFQDVRLCSFQDLVLLFFRKKKALKRFGVFGALLAFALVFFKGPAYLVEASFKEQAEAAESDGKDLVKQLFSGAALSSSMQMKSLIGSSAVLRPTVEALGLQAEWKQDSYWVRGLRRIADILRAERRRALVDVDTFRFRSLLYEEEKALFLTFFFQDKEHFEVFQGKSKIGVGALNVPLSLPNVQFTLEEIPRTLRLQKAYLVKISPWQETVRALRKKIQIEPQKANPFIYHLSLLSRDRVQGAHLLNELMAQFQSYLREEHNIFAGEQLTYLSKRQKELFSELEEEFRLQMAEMSRHLAGEGCLNLSQELQVFLTSHAKMKEKSLALDWELEHLQERSAIPEDSPLFARLQPSYKELYLLRQERDLLEASSSHLLAANRETAEVLFEELNFLREEKKKAEKSLSLLEKGMIDPDLAVLSWAKSLQETSFEGQQKQDIRDYLSHWIHLLSLREKMAAERNVHSAQTVSEFEGIDWETAHGLCKSAMRDLDESEKSLRSINQALQQIRENGFDLSCFASSLKDPMSQQLIASADALSRQLKEDKYCSAKESLRWKEDLVLQRRLLQEHLEQSLEVEKMRSSLMRNKLDLLQRVSLDCLHRRISVLQEGIQTEIAARRAQLLQEKQLLDQQMKTLRSQLAQLPEKWQSQQLFELKSKAHQGMMEAMIQLVETKTISHHLHKIGSKPIDLASLPLLPVFPYASLAIFLGALLGAGGCFFTFFLKEATLGFPINGEKLQKLKLPFHGHLSVSCDGFSPGPLFSSDIETLRSLCLFANAAPAARILSLLGGNGPDFSFSLASRFVLLGKRVCLIRCDFSATFQEKDLPGLLQYLEGKETNVPFHSLNGFDYLSSGGYSEFGAEWIQSPSFSALLAEIKPLYDLILLYFRSPLDFSESKAALKISDKAVVFIQGETIDLLTPFISWAYDKEDCRLTFIASR